MNILDTILLTIIFDQIVTLRFVLLSHLFWGTWAILQASMSVIDFDFMSYAKKRISAYHKHNELFQS